MVEMKKRRGQGGGLSALAAAALAFVIVVVVVALGALLTAEIDTQVAAIAGDDSVAQNATEAGLAGIALFGDFLPIVAIVVLIGAIIGLLLAQLGFLVFRR